MVLSAQLTRVYSFRQPHEEASAMGELLKEIAHSIMSMRTRGLSLLLGVVQTTVYSGTSQLQHASSQRVGIQRE